MSKTLLLADDSVVIQKLVGLSFANEDVEIVTTDNGDDAVLKAREIKPDVVLADVVMPGKSGYEVCEAIKQDPALAHIPVLLLTGTFEAFDEARAAAAGADGQITKPFEAQSLVERVSEVMNAPAASTPNAAFEAPVAPSSSDISKTADSSAEFDFFDPSVSTLSAGESRALLTDAPQNPNQAPPIDTSDASLFGAPGDGATDELDTRGRGMALGESVAEQPATENLQPMGLDGDETIVALPDPVTRLPPSTRDPLAAFEADLDAARNPIAAPLAVDLDSALDAVPSNPNATIVAGIDDTNASTTPNYGLDSSDNMTVAIDSIEHTDETSALPPSTPPSLTHPTDREFEDLTIHTPSAAIDQAVAMAPSPAGVRSASFESPGRADAGATVIANLDLDLAESPQAGNRLDLGPSNVSVDELDFSFDVSEQTSVSDLDESLGDSFSSLMGISESQILRDAPSSEEEAVMDESIAKPAHTGPAFDDALGAAYDVSVSDLATAPPTLESPAAAEQPVTFDRPETLVGAISTDPRVSDLDLDIALPRQTVDNADNIRIADLSPMIEQRIQETLEKVAWEAFSDLSESIVKQVIGRVEQIAWEVIPQMAETLVREEIRKMKGEND
jgi:CheY-like chemotaxis protein